MATPAQIAANRANAQKSTGPRSAEGKAASSMNSLKHGLDAQSIVLPGEDPAEYDALTQSYYDSNRPVTPEERFHVDTMIRADWHKRRLETIEADLYRTLLTESPGPPLATALLADSPAVRLLKRVQNQLAAHQRACYRALTTLRRTRESMGAAEEAFLDVYCNAPMPKSTLKPQPQPEPGFASFPSPARTTTNDLALRL